MMVQIRDAPIGDGFVEALRRAVNDPSLELWRYDHGGTDYLDPAGRARTLPSPGPALAVLPLQRGTRPVGALVYDDNEIIQGQPELLAAVSAAATLALEHDRLRNELQAQLVAVRESRERIVTAGDVQRRRLERDLHDGAQQRLVAATLLLRRAQRTPREDARRELLAAGTAELETALTELRDLARGVYPPTLAESGLAAALQGLAERAPLPVDIVDDTPTRPPAHVELAAYFIAAEALANAGKHSRATEVDIRIWFAQACLQVSITDNGRGGAVLTEGGGLNGLVDRAAALQGSLDVHSPPGAGTVVAAQLPLGLREEDRP